MKQFLISIQELYDKKKSRNLLTIRNNLSHAEERATEYCSIVANIDNVTLGGRAGNKYPILHESRFIGWVKIEQIS